MFYFREEELKKLKTFYDGSQKACAVYGRRRVGKTELILESLENVKHSLYFQVSSFDYEKSVDDFKNTLNYLLPGNSLLASLHTFKDIFSLMEMAVSDDLVIVIDEFPFLAKKNENVTAEFQWIIDHSSDRIKLVLLGSNTSFMRTQITNSSQPLYGRFDEILNILPFTFDEIHQLFPKYEDAVNVYAATGGVAQYVMFFRNYDTVQEAESSLLFDRNGRMFAEAPNLLMQEFRDITSYVSILRAVGGGEKEAGQIAEKSGVDRRIIHSYISKLEEIDVLEPVPNLFSKKKGKERYHIVDLFFRFYFTFIEPNISMITAIGSKSQPYILDSRYQEYLGFVYEDIIRLSLYDLALHGVIPFMPQMTGKWWGNIYKDGKWMESEIDVAAVRGRNVLLGECKYRNCRAGMDELNNLKQKGTFAAPEQSSVIYLIASSGGFTDELLQVNEKNLVLIEKDKVIRSAQE